MREELVPIAPQWGCGGMQACLAIEFNYLHIVEDTSMYQVSCFYQKVQGSAAFSLQYYILRMRAEMLCSIEDLILTNEYF